MVWIPGLISFLELLKTTNGNKRTFQFVDLGYVEASYLLKRDLEIQIQDPWSTIQFSVGKNYINCENIRYLKGGEVCKNGSNILIDIKEYFTMASGTCYGLKSNLPIPASQKCFNESTHQ